jgi:hypothetical protein
MGGNRGKGDNAIQIQTHRYIPPLLDVVRKTRTDERPEAFRYLLSLRGRAVPFGLSAKCVPMRPDRTALTSVMKVHEYIVAEGVVSSLSRTLLK